MGQAKARGSFEERRQEGIVKREAEELLRRQAAEELRRRQAAEELRQLEAQQNRKREARMTPADHQQRHRSRMSATLVQALLLGCVMGHRP